MPVPGSLNLLLVEVGYPDGFGNLWVQPINIKEAIATGKVWSKGRPVRLTNTHMEPAKGTLSRPLMERNGLVVTF